MLLCFCLLYMEWRMAISLFISIPVFNMSLSRALQTMTCESNVACRLLNHQWNTVTYICVHIIYGCLDTTRQSWIVVESTIFIIWPFTGKVCWPLPKSTGHINYFFLHCFISSHLLLLFTTFFFFETGAHCVAQAGLELAMSSMLALNSWPSCLSLLSAGFTDICHYAQLFLSFHF
jgi:hypothetical protein